jgi:outer membrane protein TolC
MTRRWKLLPFVAVLTLGACSLLSAGEAPQDVGPVAAERSSSVPQALSLDQATGIALKFSPQVAIAEQGVWVNRGQLLQAMSLLMPRFDVNATRSTPVNLPPFSFQKRGTTYMTDFTLSQQLYTGGSVSKGIEAAREVLQGSEQNFQRSRQQIAFSVRGAYYAVLTAEEAVSVAQDVVNSAEEHLRVARLRYEAGVAPRYDVLAAEARVARVQQGLISAESDRDTAWAGLATVMGVTIPGGTKLSTPRPEDVKPVSLTDLTTEALAQRPDVKTALAAVAAARAQVEVARAARRPTIDGAMTWNLQPKVAIPGEQLGLAPGTELVVSQNSGFISLSATWNLFNGGFVYGNIRAFQARQRQAEQAVEQLRLQIGLEVKTGYFALRGAHAQLAAARKEVEQAQEAHRVATLRYQEGVGTSVEILDAEATLQDARTRLNQAVFGLNLALAQLDLATGRNYFAPVPSTPSAGVPAVPGVRSE